MATGTHEVAITINSAGGLASINHWSALGYNCKHALLDKNELFVVGNTE
jgi:hypothetical protein